MSRLPPYAWLGLGLMAVSEAGVLLRIEPFWTWHTPITWTGYILFVDGLVWARRCDSWLRSARGEFTFLAVVSVPLWLTFEFFNLFIENWHYVNLPAPPWRYLGYAWSFATIWPAIFETGELVAAFRSSGSAPRWVSPSAAVPLGAKGLASVMLGIALLLWPLGWPSPYLAAPVWVGFVFLLDPLNARVGREALRIDLGRGLRDRMVNLCLSGMLCGLLWEFWNYWARARWEYDVPILADYRLFEMPLPGYFGFPAFALECFAMYVWVRGMLWRGSCRPLSL